MTTKRILLRSIAGGVGVSLIAGLIAFFWTLDTFLADVVVVYVMILACFGGSIFLLIAQLLIAKSKPTIAYTIIGFMVVVLALLGLWGL